MDISKLANESIINNISVEAYNDGIAESNVRMAFDVLKKYEDSMEDLSNLAAVHIRFANGDSIEVDPQRVKLIAFKNMRAVSNIKTNSFYIIFDDMNDTLQYIHQTNRFLEPEKRLEQYKNISNITLIYADDTPDKVVDIDWDPRSSSSTWNIGQRFLNVNGQTFVYTDVADEISLGDLLPNIDYDNEYDIVRGYYRDDGEINPDDKYSDTTLEALKRIEKVIANLRSIDQQGPLSQGSRYYLSADYTGFWQVKIEDKNHMEVDTHRVFRPSDCRVKVTGNYDSYWEGIGAILRVIPS